MSESDLTWMLEAVAAATNARNWSRPNPWVGAVLVKDGVEVGRGWTSPAGGPHAEVHAIAQASRRARGATLYTTLEPCSHHGRTPPCTEAIIEAGITRVVIGVVDPDTNVSGNGVEALRAAGIEVTTGVAQDEVAHQLRAYLHQRKTGRPYVVAKAAVTADGFITIGANTKISSRSENEWITGEVARNRVHQIRAESDAIVVGAGTVRDDDPALTVRSVEGRDPLRVVLGSAAAAARVHPCVQWDQGVSSLVDHLGGMGMIQLLVEGGTRVFTEFRDAGLIDELVIHRSPRIANDGKPLFSDVNWASVSDWCRDSRVAVTSLESDTEYVIPRAVFAPEHS